MSRSRSCLVHHGSLMARWASCVASPSTTSVGGDARMPPEDDSRRSITSAASTGVPSGCVSRAMVSAPSAQLTRNLPSGASVVIPTVSVPVSSSAATSCAKMQCPSTSNRAAPIVLSTRGPTSSERHFRAVACAGSAGSMNTCGRSRRRYIRVDPASCGVDSSVPEASASATAGEERSRLLVTTSVQGQGSFVGEDVESARCDDVASIDSGRHQVPCHTVHLLAVVDGPGGHVEACIALEVGRRGS